jgi:hypothetical protein
MNDNCLHDVLLFLFVSRKILELDAELKFVSNNMKLLQVAEQEVKFNDDDDDDDDMFR